ncbi:ionotropic receptor 75a isoform X2 [Drosophila pseudoobscura]|uniref:Ionotropic receptor 75a isoform X2 n=1 Tax=Drosophila pseudoobscura pseudoobscura TaxID=46245 RepID=A0A6I8W1F2_DROPS|nr:ionotropic receptor 75a isoform X2 [Drosophila pseudoobscura]
MRASIALILLIAARGAAAHMDISVLTKFIVNLVGTNEAIIFSCSDKDLQLVASAFMKNDQFVNYVHMKQMYSLPFILGRNSHGRTSVIVNTRCNGAAGLLADASANKYFNKTYQWVFWGVGVEVKYLLPLELDYIGPNAQITYVNKTSNDYCLWDIHSKGRHLQSPLQLQLIATVTNYEGSSYLNIARDIFKLQSTEYRGQFNGITLRGASVIDQEDITTNEQIEAILSRSTKDSGVAAFIKYHYELVGLLRDRFNFSVNFRNSRGWAGRLGNTTFRLGLLGVVKRDEADIAASGAFNRLNRFAEFDTIHQSWKFEAAFIYRFTPDLDTHGKSGNFLAPFSKAVWFLILVSLIVFSVIWVLFEIINSKLSPTNDPNDQINNIPDTESQKCYALTIQSSWVESFLQSFAALCQQGLDPIPKDHSSRFVVITIFLFSLVIYNYYTSSVVGGLLSSSDKGPATVDEITSSPLTISFEDIGYYKVLFRESKSPAVARLIKTKLSSSRPLGKIPVFAHIEEAVPYIKSGGFAFHCEVVAAYPLIAELFDASEICDLREVSGLMEVELLNWILPKNSQYTELFKVAMCSARERGFVERLLRQRQIRKPTCQSLYTVYPVTLSGALAAFFVLICGIIMSILMLSIEIIYVYVVFKRGQQFSIVR